MTSTPTPSSPASCARFRCRTWCCSAISESAGDDPDPPEMIRATDRPLLRLECGGSCGDSTGASRAGIAPSAARYWFRPRWLRPYVEGDDARHIDWNVTARLDEPQVREFNEDRADHVARPRPIRIHGGRWPGPRETGRACRLALVLARLLGRNGSNVGAILYDTGTTRIVPPGTGRNHALRIDGNSTAVRIPGRPSPTWPRCSTRSRHWPVAVWSW